MKSDSRTSNAIRYIQVQHEMFISKIFQRRPRHKADATHFCYLHFCYSEKNFYKGYTDVSSSTRGCGAGKGGQDESRLLASMARSKFYCWAIVGVRTRLLIDVF